MKPKKSIAVLFLSTILIVACHPVVPTDTCKQQISACLAKCEPDVDIQKQSVATRTETRGPRNTCEQTCMHCSTTAAASSQPAPAPTPTGQNSAIPPEAVSPPQGITLSPDADAGADPMPNAEN